MTETSLVLGFALILLGGIMEGSYSFPLKMNPKWDWEHTWGAGSLMALLLVPWPLAFFTVPGLAQVYHQSSWSAILLALLFGAGWGFGGVFFGLSINMVGLSLGYSIIFGIIAINGSLTPLLMNEPGKLVTTGGLWFLAAMSVMLLGIIVCAVAGNLKAKAANTTSANQSKSGSFGVGLILCILCRRSFRPCELCVHLRHRDYATSTAFRCGPALGDQCAVGACIYRQLCRERRLLRLPDGAQRHRK